MDSRISAFVDAIDTLFLILTPDGRIQAFNRVCQEVTGYTLEEVQGQYVWDQFFSTREKQFLNSLFQQVQHPPYRNSYENLWITKDGQYRLISFTNCAIVAEGRVRQICVTGVDITQHRRMTEELWKYRILLEEQVRKRTAELKASQTRFAGILEISEAAIVSADEFFNIIIFNRGAEKTFGYEASEVIGQPLNILLPKRFHAGHNQFMRRFLESDQPSRNMSERSEIYGTRKDGSEFVAEATISKLTINDEMILTAMLQDITERRRIELELRNAKEQAEASNLAKTQFLANMSHEIRTPLNSIVGLSQILMHRSRDLSLPREFQDYLEDIRVSGENLSELINNILDLSKIEAGKQVACLDAVNLRVLVQGVYQINKVQALEKDIRFSYYLEPTLPPMIQSDRTMLNQILMNLIGNAIKFTPSGKSVELQVRQEKSELILDVIDQGIGIPAEHQQAIFESFEQADKSITRAFGGSGLGLSITHSMVQSLSGNIELRSDAGRGACFTVRLPLNPVSESAGELPDHAFDLRFAEDNLVLLVEDNLKNQKMMQALFSDLGLPLEVASNGPAALELVQAHRPDLVLMDMHMPEMDGLETTKRLLQLENGSDVPVVILSADAFLYQQEEALATGIAGYLTKPLDFRKLFPVLQRYLRWHAENPETPDTLAADGLTPETIVQLQACCMQLRDTPLFLADDIIRLVQQMIQLCGETDTPFVPLLQQVEYAMFNRASQTVPDLIDKLCSLLEDLQP